ncbi:MAG: U32 family peptidase [Fibromonadaceae bacterium]|jgi:putative protease|nr:U32 family peptidase [Fibromonadaceae bacterium]
MPQNQIEIMAPAGSYESLMAAINAGADSVYFGVENLNMRARNSNNFSLEDLAKIAAICKDKRIKTYLTLNTVIYDSEIEQMQKIVNAAAKNRIDAIIASDTAVLCYAHKMGVQIHASTQLNISNIEAVEFFSQFCDVVVLARELTLLQIAGIAKEIERRQIKGPSGNLVKIEIFCHGALCMAISGKCYLSLHHYNHSANRGECFQICRRSYMARDLETGEEIAIDNKYIMSPKDLCTIEFIDKIIEAGVEVLKIEGRARAPEYVKTAVECYRQAVNAHFEKSLTEEKAKSLKERLATVFNRGFWEGCYLGARLGELSDVHGTKAARTKVYLGKVTNYFSKIGVAEITFETGEELCLGEDVLIIGANTGVVEQKATELRENEKSVNKVQKASVFSMPVSELVRRGDKLYKLSNPLQCC